MSRTKKDAEQLHASLQRAARGERIEGELAPLVQTAQLASSLAEPPPPPPHQLAPGRQRFLTEAATLRAGKKSSQKRVAWMPRTLRLAGALLAVVLVFGAILGVGQAAAGSLPGEPLYALKLTAEAILVQWTAEPDAKAGLASSLVAERLEEITKLIEQGQPVGEPTMNRAQEQLVRALQATRQVDAQAALQSSQQLETTLRVQEQAIRHAIDARPQTEQSAVQDLLREIERVRKELYTGQGEPNGDQQRLRMETPPDLPDAPDPAGQPGPNPRPEATPTRPKRPPDAGSGSGPWPGERPARPAQPEGTGLDEDPTPGPGAQQPAGSQQGEDPGSGPDPQQPVGPQPTQDPGSESGPQQPAGPQPTGGPGTGSNSGDDPGSGSGHQPEEDPGSGPGPQQPGGSQSPEPAGTDPGGGKP